MVWGKEELDRAVEYNKTHKKADKKKFTKKTKSNVLNQTIEYIKNSDYRLFGDLWSKDREEEC